MPLLLNTLSVDVLNERANISFSGQLDDGQFASVSMTVPLAVSGIGSNTELTNAGKAAAERYLREAIEALRKPTPAAAG